MPLLNLLLILLMGIVAALVLMPLGLMQRYRAGTARRAARPWLATINIVAIALSVLLFVCGATITSFWIPKALIYSVAGLAGGFLLGVIGVALTRWEGAPGSLHYTPNRLLTLFIILIVAARLAYGVWRLWQGWGSGVDDRAWLRESGVPGSLAAGAIVLGYSLTYWVGVARRTLRYRRT